MIHSYVTKSRLEISNIYAPSFWKVRLEGGRGVSQVRCKGDLGLYQFYFGL